MFFYCPWPREGLWAVGWALIDVVQICQRTDFWGTNRCVKAKNVNTGCACHWDKSKWYGKYLWYEWSYFKNVVDPLPLETVAQKKINTLYKQSLADIWPRLGGQASQLTLTLSWEAAACSAPLDDCVLTWWCLLKRLFLTSFCVDLWLGVSNVDKCKE